MILAQQLTTLDTEITQLQALIEAKRQQQEQLAQLDIQTGDALGLIKVCLEDLGKVAPDAIASLRSAVIKLFDSNDDGGTDPTPDNDPTPGLEVEEVELLCLNGETGDYLTTIDLQEDKPLTYPQTIKARASSCFGYQIESKNDLKHAFINRCSISPMEGVWLDQQGKDFYKHCENLLDKYFYTGQACEWASPFACPVTFDETKYPSMLNPGSRFGFGAPSNKGTVMEALKADEYLCQIDGAVGEVELERLSLHHISSSLEGQLCDIDKAPLTGQKCEWATPFACPVEIIPQPIPSVTEMIHLSAQCGYLKLKATRRILAAYCWFSRKNIAESWMQQLEVVPNAKVEMRESKRNSSWKWELKIIGLSMQQIERLASEKLHQKPLSATETPAQAAGIEPPSDWGKVQQLEESGADPMTCILNCNDVVEVIGNRYPQHCGKVGTVEGIANLSELPILVRTPLGKKGYHRSDLKFISKGEPTQRQGLQSEQELLGGKVVTTGTYFGQRRRNAINTARMGTADKVAALELVKAGVSPEEAMAAATGADDASDF
jgi:hypothetical protein